MLKSLDTLAQDERESMTMLGVKNVHHAVFPNILMNMALFLGLVQFIETCIKNWRAKLIISHHSVDINLDHAMTSSIVIMAFRLYQR